MLETVNADADRVTRLLTELLDVSRIDAGRLEVRKQVVDVPGRRPQGRQRAGGRGRARGPVRRGRARRAARDVGRPRQARPGGRQPRRERPAARRGHGHGRVAPYGDGVEVVVSDEGEGIPEETAARVFTRFWRGSRRGGTGLGLYIVKGLVEAHGGSVEVRRAPSGGAAFRFVLPAGTPSYL